MLHLCRLMVAAAGVNRKAPGLHLLLPPHTLISVSGVAAPRLAHSRTVAQPPCHPGRLASTSSSAAAAAAALAVPEPAAVQPLPDAAAAAAAVAGAAATQSTLQQQQQQQQQQQRVHTTKLLAINADTLPAAAAPDRDAAVAILTAPDAPDLSPDSCPHLYYQLASSSSSSDALQEAAPLLRSGQPVAIPTETVYGLAADGLSAAAVAAVYAAKGRPSDNPLILHISDLDMLARLYPQQQQQQQDCSSSNDNGCTHSSSSSSRLAFLPKQYHRLIAAFWPGPLTLLLPASPIIPAAVTAGLPTVAVRMPAHPVARALIAAAGVPLAAPSANTSGRPSPTTAQHVMQDLAGRVAAVVDGGPCTCGVESTVLDGLRDPPVVLRPGGITPELLGLSADMQGLQVYQRDFTDKQLEDTPTTPGMKYRHYSPTAPLLLLDPTAAWQAQQQEQEKQQHMHDGLQQLVVNATQQLLEDLWQAQQQQQQQQTAQDAGKQRVVLLSTCSSSSSTKVGWTEASLKLLQQHKQEHAQPLGSPSDPQPAANGRSTALSSRPDVLEYVLGSWQHPEVVAQQVFAALRAADSVGPALIIAQGLPPEGPALAIMNRLQKAASQHVQVAATVVPRS